MKIEEKKFLKNFFLFLLCSIIDFAILMLEAGFWGIYIIQVTGFPISFGNYKTG